MKIAFIDRDFRPEALRLIDRANTIVVEYTAAGYCLTLRQLYYQFVSRDWLPNTERSYKRLGGVVSDGRLAGLIDWDAIEDRGRSLRKLPTWTTPKDILRTCAQQYRIDCWADQERRVEVWIEKEALLGVIAGICDDMRVPYFACKGYTSTSELWEAGHRRLSNYRDDGQIPVILHLGDHDPSGIDMTRDLRDRLSLFFGGPVRVERIALNWDQIEAHRPPPNPAKITDARFASYQTQYGSNSWELDALTPSVLIDLIDRHVRANRDEAIWAKSLEREETDRGTLKELMKNAG